MGLVLLEIVKTKDQAGTDFFGAFTKGQVVNKKIVSQEILKTFSKGDSFRKLSDQNVIVSRNFHCQFKYRYMYKISVNLFCLPQNLRRPNSPSVSKGPKGSKGATIIESHVSMASNCRTSD